MVVNRRTLINNAPRPIRDYIIRSQVRVPSDLPQLLFKVAETAEELEQAFALLHDAYVGVGFMAPHPSGLRLTTYHLLPTTYVLVGVERETGVVVATVSVVCDSPEGLPMTDHFDLTAQRRAGRIAEISALAVARKYRSSDGACMLHLVNFMFNFCNHHLKLGGIAVCVNPSHFPFYESLLFFKKLPGEVKSYGFANNNPAVAGYLDFAEAPALFAAHYHGRSPKKDLFSFFIEGVRKINYLLACDSRQRQRALENTKALWARLNGGLSAA